MSISQLRSNLRNTVLPLIVLLSSFHANAIEIGSEEAAQFTSDFVSGTLPVMYIQTVDDTPILDKENKIPASMWIEIPSDCSVEFEPVASKEKPLELTIKGRGNSSWFGAEKKPYKLKLDKKTALLGMPKHKHWAILAHALGNFGHYVNVAGFAIGNQLGMPWVPRRVPVEVVLNNEYIGLYDLTESVKIDQNRIDIFEQPEENEDEATIPYGWLVEIDNYADEYQVIVPEVSYREMRVTHKSPEVLSEAQREWLINEFTDLNQIIYSQKKEIAETWANRIDAQSAAQYFITRELLHDFDGYNGSMYLHRDAPATDGEAEAEPLWKLGPLWDMAFQNDDVKPCWAFDDERHYGNLHWMMNLTMTDAFKNAFNEAWDNFYPQGIESIIQLLEKEGELCSRAEAANNKRWQSISANTSFKVSRISEVLRSNAQWIQQNRELIGIFSALNSIDIEESFTATVQNGTIILQSSTPTTIHIYNITGTCVSTLKVEGTATVNLPKGYYLLTTPTKTLKLTL